MSPTRIKRRYGLPWAGYRSSTAPHMTPPDYATSDGPSSSRRSRNFLYDTQEQKFYRRAGISVVGGTAGILEDGTGEMTVARARQLAAMKSSSLSDGYATHSVLYTEEGNNKGCLYFRSTNSGGANHVLGQEFGTTQYPTAANTVSYAKLMPHIRTSDGTMGRFNTVALRAQALAGSRRMLDVGDWRFFPDLTGVPVRWNRRFNEDNADTGDVWRIWHTGSPSPLGLPSIAAGTVNTSGTWHDADIFYISVAFRMADGSTTMPVVPRDRNDQVNLTASPWVEMTGFGKVQIDSAGSNKYLYLTWSDIPTGPEGTVGRFLLRTPKKDGATGAGSTPSPFDLRITAYIANNTQTTYQDPNGNDLALVVDPLVIRFDHIQPPPARYISSFDGRIAVGYTKPHPVAIYLAPYVNAQDNDATIDDTIYGYSLAAGVLTLYKGANSTALTADSTRSVQQLVDSINNTTDSGSNGGKWFACVAPGADSSVACGNGAGANQQLSTTTGVDFGDATAGRMRCYGTSWPGCVFFSTTYLNQFATEKRRLFFTTAGPGLPIYTANTFTAGNYRTGSEEWGDLVGMAPLANGLVVCFSKAIALLQNRRAGSTGEDSDYRLYELNPLRGCIAWDSITTFNGAVGYLTADGYVVTDGNSEVVISGDVWNPANSTGEWSYEISECIKGSNADSDLAHFHAAVMGGKLYITYRLTSAATVPNRMLIYDFTGSAQKSGIAGVLRPDGQPWGWSTPLTGNVSVMGEVRGSAGIARYATDEQNAGATSNGRVEQIETGTTDNGSAFTSDLWSARDLADHLGNKSLQQIRMVTKKNGTGRTFSVYRDGLGSTADAALTLATTSTDNFRAEVLPMPQLARAPTRSLEFQWTDDGSGSDAPQEWGIEAEMLILNSYS